MDYVKSKYKNGIWSKTGQKHYFGEIYQRDEFYEATEATFEEITIAKVPKEYDKHLRHMYGNYMDIPIERKRITACGFKISSIKYEERWKWTEVWKQEKLTLQEMNMNLELLKIFIEICEQNNLKYYMAGWKPSWRYSS